MIERMSNIKQSITKDKEKPPNNDTKHKPIDYRQEFLTFLDNIADAGLQLQVVATNTKKRILAQENN